jgi:hypothetical protein
MLLESFNLGVSAIPKIYTPLQGFYRRFGRLFPQNFIFPTQIGSHLQREVAVHISIYFDMPFQIIFKDGDTFRKVFVDIAHNRNKHPWNEIFTTKSEHR